MGKAQAGGKSIVSRQERWLVWFNQLRIIFRIGGPILILSGVIALFFMYPDLQSANAVQQDLNPLFGFAFSLSIGLHLIILSFLRVPISYQARQHEQAAVPGKKVDHALTNWMPPPIPTMPTPEKLFGPVEAGASSSSGELGVSVEETMEIVPSAETQRLGDAGVEDPRKTNKLTPSYATLTASLAFRYYMVAREGKRLDRSADKLAFEHQAGRYAVADGVATSFLPARWAQIVTEHFVRQRGDFMSNDEIVKWLEACSEEWHTWVEEEWVPAASEGSGQADWSREIERGAATTFVGCSFSREELAQSGETSVNVYVVGDAEFFLFARAPTTSVMTWTCKDFYRLDLEDFGQTTETLATPARRVARDYKWLHHTCFRAQRGDCIVLATDALAQWMLRRIEIEHHDDPLAELLALPDEAAFANFVNYYRASSEIEVDDTTLMIIPVSSEIPSVRSKN